MLQINLTNFFPKSGFISINILRTAAYVILHHGAIFLFTTQIRQHQLVCTRVSFAVGGLYLIRKTDLWIIFSGNPGLFTGHAY